MSVLGDSSGDGDDEEGGGGGDGWWLYIHLRDSLQLSGRSCFEYLPVFECLVVARLACQCWMLP